MTFRAVDVYELLEPLLKDYRKLRLRNSGEYTHTPSIHFAALNTDEAGFSLTFMDEFVHALLNEERVCDIIMPRLIKRQVLEENSELGPRKSLLLDAMEGTDEPDNVRGRTSGSEDRSRSGSRSPSQDRKNSSRSGSRYMSRSPSGSRHGSESFRSRSRSKSADHSDSGQEEE